MQQKYIIYETFRGMLNYGADWMHLLRNNSVGLSRWVVFYPKKYEQEADNFIKTLLGAARSFCYSKAKKYKSAQLIMLVLPNNLVNSHTSDAYQNLYSQINWIGRRLMEYDDA